MPGIVSHSGQGPQSPLKFAFSGSRVCGSADERSRSTRPLKLATSSAKKPGEGAK
jgi:hypothetical protein